MAENMIGRLFGLSPEIYGEQQRIGALQEGIDLAKLDPATRGAALTYAGAKGLGGAIAGAMGVQDPQLKLISARQQILSQMDQADPQSMANAVKQLSQMGDQQGAMALSQLARQAQGEMALTQQRQAAQQASLASLAKTQFGMEQEKQLRDELAKLGPNPTQDQILSVVSKYGPPEKVLSTLQASADRASQRETTLQIAREKIEAEIKKAEQAGADKKELKQMEINGRQTIAELAASLKGPSAAVLKAQEKADKIAEGQAALSDTLSTAETLVKDLAKMGGMTSTSKTPLANLVTSLQTGTAGQMAGRAFGTAEQAKRDELKSIRLQLLNSVKEATGMSAQQLNSNVELKTYLDSLGSEGMTKEANLAILENLSRRYLRGNMNAPAKGVGTAENPIVLK
jgi:hypothetical protein